jgi:hypothetical protein
MVNIERAGGGLFPKAETCFAGKSNAKVWIPWQQSVPGAKAI